MDGVLGCRVLIGVGVDHEFRLRGSIGPPRRFSTSHKGTKEFNAFHESDENSADLAGLESFSLSHQRLFAYRTRPKRLILIVVEPVIIRLRNRAEILKQTKTHLIDLAVWIEKTFFGPGFVFTRIQPEREKTSIHGIPVSNFFRHLGA